MLAEENLTAFAVKRDDRDNLQGLLNHATNLNKERAQKIEDIVNEHTEKERNRLEGKIDFGTQTIIGANYFNKKP